MKGSSLWWTTVCLAVVLACSGYTVNADNQILTDIQTELGNIDSSLEELVGLFQPTTSSVAPTEDSTTDQSTVEVGSSTEKSSTGNPIDTSTTEAGSPSTEPSTKPSEASSTSTSPSTSASTEIPDGSQNNAQRSNDAEEAEKSTTDASTTEDSSSTEESTTEEPTSTTEEPTSTTEAVNDLCNSEEELCLRLTNVLEDIQVATAEVADGDMGEAQLTKLKSCSSSLDSVVEELKNETDFVLNVTVLMEKKEILHESISEAQEAVEKELNPPTEPGPDVLAIVLGTIGGVIAAAILGYGGFVLYKKSKAKKARRNNNPLGTMESSSGRDNSGFE